jgi:hypothetical protein
MNISLRKLKNDFINICLMIQIGLKPVATYEFICFVLTHRFQIFVDEIARLLSKLLENIVILFVVLK